MLLSRRNQATTMTILYTWIGIFPADRQWNIVVNIEHAPQTAENKGKQKHQDSGNTESCDQQNQWATLQVKEHSRNSPLDFWI